MKRILIGVVLATFHSLCAGQEILEHIASRLETHPEVSGQFIQQRHVEFLNKPLTSSGNFIIGRETGLEWRVKAPVKSNMLIKDGKLTLNGKKVSDMGAGALMAVIMQSFFEGDFSQLKQHFEIDGEAGENSWSVLLTPRSDILKKGIQAIQLQGASYLTGISMREVYGSSTSIELYNFRVEGG